MTLLTQGATKVQPTPESCAMLVIVAQLIAWLITTYVNGPCRNRTYNLLVASRCPRRPNHGRNAAYTRETVASSEPDAGESTPKGATKVQPRGEIARAGIPSPARLPGDASGNHDAESPFVRVDQDGFGPVEGNCFAAALACLSRIPLDTLTAQIGCGYGPDDWWEQAVAIMRGHGFELDYTGRCPKGYAIYSGQSPRDLPHVVIGCDGRIVHDPHPSRAGLVTVTGYYTLTPLASGVQP